MSAAWDEEVVPEVSGAGSAAEERSLLERAACAADVPPEELPDRVEQLSGKIRDLQSQIESMRDGWVETYWQGLERDLDPEPPRVVAVTLDRGTHDDARAFAIHALETEGEMVLAVGRADATVGVGVNESVTEREDRYELSVTLSCTDEDGTEVMSGETEGIVWKDDR